MPPTTLHLVDASPYIFRAFHALPSSIVDPDGRPVNAVYGFATFLLRLRDTETPAHLALCFDGSFTTSFRNRIYADYKARREPPPAELEAQADDCRAVGAALGMATFVDDEYEADDLIATLAAVPGDEAEDLVVVSSDKDLAQLVTERVALFDFARQRRFGPAEVMEKLGVRPPQVPDLLGLAGDAVDNIPGVPGIGAKTAVALLRAFDSLEELLDAVRETPEIVAGLPIRGARGVATRLAEHSEQARLSKRLATVSRRAPVESELAELRYRGPDEAAVDELCARLGFDRLRERLLSAPAPRAR